MDNWIYWVLILIIVVVVAGVGWYFWSHGLKIKFGGGCCGTFGGAEDADDWLGAHDDISDIVDGGDDAFGGVAAPRKAPAKGAPVKKYGDAVVFPVNSEEALALISSGKKTIEARPGRASYRSLTKGSKVVYVHGDKGVEKVVVAVREYPDFEALLKAEPLDKVMPGAKSAADALKTIEGFYAKLAAKGVDFGALQKKLKVLAIEVK